MSELTVAARYAKSLIDLAEEQKSVEAVNGDMELFFRTLKANPELKAVLANPIISHAKKIKVLDEVFGDKVTKTSIAFFKLMINKSRGEVLYTTAQEYTNMYAECNYTWGQFLRSLKLLCETGKGRPYPYQHRAN